MTERIFYIAKQKGVKYCKVSIEKNENDSFTITQYKGHCDNFGGFDNSKHVDIHTEHVLVGKAGRTVEEQANSRYESVCNDLIKSGAKEKYEDLFNQSKFDAIKPMLAEKGEDKTFSKLSFPIFIQPKFDGVRCLANIDVSGKGANNKLKSRQNRPYDPSKKLEEALQCVRKVAQKDLILDGELYVHGIPFQDVLSIITDKSGTIDRECLEYHVYDVIINDDMPFNRRHNNLNWLLFGAKMLWDKNHALTDGADFPIKNVLTESINNMEEAEAKRSDYVSQGYEGAILRVPDGIYEPGKRSKNLIKFKKFIDDEFEIVDIVDGKGKDEGCGRFVCKADKNSDLTFTCKFKGSYDKQKEIFKNKDKYIGKMLTVKFFEYYTATEGGVKMPRFPNGIAVRDYE